MFNHKEREKKHASLVAKGAPPQLQTNNNEFMNVEDPLNDTMPSSRPQTSGCKGQSMSCLTPVCTSDL